MKPDSTIDQQSNSQFYNAWIEDGILYHKYHDELTLSVVLDAERKSLTLLKEQHLPIAPVIILLESIDKTRYKLTMADYGRVLSTFDLATYASGIWIVGVAEEVKQTIITIGSYFLVNRIFFANNIEEAKESACLFTPASLSIIDPE